MRAWSRRTMVVGASAWLTAGILGRPAWGQARGDRPILIRKPEKDAAVGRDLVVEGAARLPPGQFLWVLARREDFDPLWWPQRQAVPDAKDGSWKATASFGGPQDIGWKFDVAAVAVDGATHARLRDYWVKAMASGDWRPIEIPAVISTVLVKVKKVSH